MSKNQNHIREKRSLVLTQPGHPQGLGQGRQGATGQTCLRAPLCCPLSFLRALFLPCSWDGCREGPRAWDSQGDL